MEKTEQYCMAASYMYCTIYLSPPKKIFPLFMHLTKFPHCGGRGRREGQEEGKVGREGTVGPTSCICSLVILYKSYSTTNSRTLNKSVETSVLRGIKHCITYHCNTTQILKRQSNEIFDLQFFSSSEPASATGHWVKIFSNLVSFSPKYSYFSVEKTDSTQYHTARSKKECHPRTLAQK